jgi:hypothetical protein
MSSSFWLLGVQSGYFSQAEKEIIACKAEQIHKMKHYLENKVRVVDFAKDHGLVKF